MSKDHIYYDIHIIGSCKSPATAETINALQKAGPHPLSKIGLNGEEYVGGIGFRVPEGVVEIGKITRINLVGKSFEAVTEPDGPTLISQKIIFVTEDKPCPEINNTYGGKVSLAEQVLRDQQVGSLVAKTKGRGIIGVGLSADMISLYAQLAERGVPGGVTALYYGGDAGMRDAYEALGLNNGHYPFSNGEMRVVPRETLSSNSTEALLRQAGAVILSARRVNDDIGFWRDGRRVGFSVDGNGQARTNSDHQLLEFSENGFTPIPNAWGIGRGYGFVPVEVSATSVAKQISERRLALSGI